MRETVLPIQFNVCSVGEDDRFAGVQFRGPVGVTPENIETCGRVETGKGRLAVLRSDRLGKLAQDGFEDYRFDLGQKPLGGTFLAVAVLHPGVFGERAQPGPNAGDHQVRPGNPHLPQGVHALPNDAPKLWNYIGLIVPGLG